MKYMNSKLFFLFLFMFISTVSLYMLNAYKTKDLDSFLKLQTAEAKHKYDGMVLFPRDTSNLVFNYLINTKEVIDIFKNAYKSDDIHKDIIRKKLYAHLSTTYNNLKVYNIQQLHFHLPNSDSFLRFHRPDKFGDNLATVRKTVARANGHKVIVEGFEEGRVFNGYRFVYPLFDEQKNHIGSVEISHSINSFKSTYQRVFNNIDIKMILSKDVVSTKVFKDEKKNYEICVINENFMYQKSMIVEKYVDEISKSLKNRDDVQDKMNNFKDFSISVVYEKCYYVVSFIAIQNVISKKSIAYVISFQKSKYLSRFYKDSLFQIIYILSLSLFITLVFYYIRQYHLELKRQVYHDSLMNIYNRRFFETYLTEACHKQQRNNADLSLIMFDVDHFKHINDTHGHDVGDEALLALGEIVKNNTRKSDIFARWGGEEFMLLIEVNETQAYKVAENLRIAIQKGTKELVTVPEFSCSFGVAGLQNIENIEDACKLVDEKLYKAKNSGRNRVVI